MTVFKAYLKILKKNMGMVIFYTMLMVTFAGMAVSSSDKSLSFEEEKPNIVIINNDKEEGITKEFIKFLKKNTNVKKMTDKNQIKDAIFYHEISYVIYIPKNFRNDFLNNKDAKIETDESEDYGASLAKILVENYLTTALKYKKIYNDENMVINKLSEYENENTKVEIKRLKNVSKLSKLAYYFSYANYPILAGIIYAVYLIISSFNEIKIKRRNNVSSTNYKKFSRDLILSNLVFISFMFTVYVLLAFILNGKVLFTSNGIFHIVNMLAFTICALTIAFTITSLINNKNAINGIIQVVALGSSFLCGSFVPMEMLPNSVIKIAHMMPSYYYIKNNEIIKTVDVFTIASTKPIVINILVILLFAFLFIMLSITINRIKRVD